MEVLAGVTAQTPCCFAGGQIFFTENGKKQVVFVDAKSKAMRAVDTGINAPKRDRSFT